MAENELQDAKITLKLAVDDSELKKSDSPAEDPRRARGGRARPGGRPPSPGRFDERREVEAEARRNRISARRVREKRERASKAGPGKRRRSLVGRAAGAVGGLVSVATLANVVPSIIEKRLSQLDAEQIIARKGLELLRDTVGVGFEQIGKAFRALESGTAAIGATVSGAVSVGRANEVLGLKLSPADIAKVARRQGSIAAIESSFRTTQRAFGQAALTGAALEAADAAKEALKTALEDAAATSK